ncbi:hypothetical protein PC119_g2032 [Phytophthora cactorum]|nr:hypothetical protein PC119_g2032 [Phytophthora cactorum]
MVCVEEDFAQKQSARVMALCQSWNAFVENFNKDATAYRARITAVQQRFETFSRRHMIDRLHNEAMEAGIPCAVPFGNACSHCPLGLSVSLSETSPGTRLCVYLFSCVISSFKLNVVMNVVTLRVSAVIAALVQALRLHSVLGFVRPHHSRSVFHQDVPRFPCISPTIRSIIHRVEPRASRSGGGGGGKIPLPLWNSSRVGSSSKVQQELRYQKAQVAQAVQTASNFQVELGTQVMRLHDRVAALEKLDYAASSSSASHQG